MGKRQANGGDPHANDIEAEEQRQRFLVASISTSTEGPVPIAEVGKQGGDDGTDDLRRDGFVADGA